MSFNTVGIQDNLPVLPVHVLQIIQSLTFSGAYSAENFFREGRTNFGAAAFTSSAHVEMHSYDGNAPLVIYGGPYDETEVLAINAAGNTAITSLSASNSTAITGSIAKGTIADATISIATIATEAVTNSTISTGSIGLLTATKAAITTLTGSNNLFTTVIATTLTSSNNLFTQVSASYVTASNFRSDTAIITTLTGSNNLFTNVVVSNLTSSNSLLTTVTASNVQVTTAISTANATVSNTANIDTANITDAAITTAVIDDLTSGNAIVTGSFTGSLEGVAATASYVAAANVDGTVTSASYAHTASYVNPLTQDVSIDGTVSASNGALIGTYNQSQAVSVQTSNTDYTNTAGSGASIILSNDQDNTGQTVIAFTNNTNGGYQTKGKVRVDLAGNMSYVAYDDYIRGNSTGSHVFYIGGDYSVGTVAAQIADTKITLARTTDITGSLQVTGSLKVTAAATTVHRVTGSVNISGSLLINNSGSLVIPTTSSATPTTGQIYFDIVTNKLNVYNGTTWVTASLGA